jgi:glutamate-1-semialdehyde 2,1-aminomutase
MTIETDYLARTHRSREHHAAAETVIPAGSTRSLNSWPPYPVYVESGNGARIRDIDGNSYRDFLNNYTALPLGYADPDVTAALSEQLTGGTSHSFSRTLERELAEIITGRIASVDKVRFTGSGTEAVMFALRLARAFTGRTGIAKAEGGYHGTIDDVMISVRPPKDLAGEASAPVSLPEMKGIPAARMSGCVVIPFNDIEATTTLLRRHGHDLAAVIIEPVLGVGGMIPADREYLTCLRELCDELGMLLIFDEVITLRLHLGGAQELYGIRPDLTTMGKIIGGGLPIGAYGGRADVMALLEPQGGTDVYDARSGGPALYQGGTFTGNALSLTAGIVTLGKLDQNLIEAINERGEQLRTAVSTALAVSPVEGTVTGIGSLFNLHVGPAAVQRFRDTWLIDGSQQHQMFLGLLNRGVVIAARGMGCVSSRTTPEDIDVLATAVLETATTMSATALAGATTSGSPRSGERN